MRTTATQGAIIMVLAWSSALASCSANVVVDQAPPPADVTLSSSSGAAGDAGADAPDCHACAPGERCLDGACCAPLTCSPGVCGSQVDGCGMTRDCDVQCGDGAWMFCGSLHRCRCTNATELQGGDAAERLCEQRGGRQGYACGEASPDAPAECELQPEIIGDGPRLWCCR